MNFLRTEIGRIALLAASLALVWQTEDDRLIYFDNEADAIAWYEQQLERSEGREKGDWLIQNYFLRGGEREKAIISALELVDDQKTRLEEIREEYLEAKRDLGPPPSVTDKQVFYRWSREEQLLESHFARQARECLLDSQVEGLKDLSFDSRGIPRLLVESPLEDVLRINPTQKKKIEAASKRIAEKIARMNREIREESIREVLGSLTKEQKRRFFEIYSDEQIQWYYEFRYLSQFFTDHNLDNEADLNNEFDIGKDE